MLRPRLGWSVWLGEDGWERVPVVEVQLALVGKGEECTADFIVDVGGGW